MARSSVALTLKDLHEEAEKITVADFFKNQSRFNDGLTFSIEKVKTVAVVQDANDVPDANTPQAVVFVTNVTDDEQTVIWLSSYRERNMKLDINNQPVPRDGSFDKLVFAEFAKVAQDSTKPLEDVANDILKSLAGRKVVVRRKFYTEPRYGKTASVPCFDIVENA